MISGETTPTLENTVINLRTAIGGMLLVLGSIIAGTVGLVRADDSIKRNADDIEELRAESKTNAKTLHSIDRKLDRLALELKIRDVISETAAAAAEPAAAPPPEPDAEN